MFLKFLILTFFISISSVPLKATDEVIVNYDVLNNVEIDYDALDCLGSNIIKNNINLKKPNVSKKNIVKKASKPVKVYKKEIKKASNNSLDVIKDNLKNEIITNNANENIKVEEKIIKIEDKKDIVQDVLIKEQINVSKNEVIPDVEKNKVNSKYLVIYFKENGTILSDSDLNKLKSLYNQYDQTSKMKIISYASGVKGNKSSAKRTSLSRALAVRSELISLGVKSSLIEVRALGQSINPEKSDCVEITLIK